MRKLDIGGTLSRVFDLYGKQAGVLLPAALIVFLPITIAIAVLNAIAVSAVGAPTTPQDFNNVETMDPNALGAIGLGATLVIVITALLTIIGTYWYQGVVVEAVQDMEDGKRDFSVGQLFSTSGRYVPRLIGAALLVALIFVAIMIIPGILTAVVPPLGVFVIVIAVLVLIWLWVRWSLLSPAIVVEDRSATESLGRSSSLVEGNWWRVFLVLIVIGIIGAVINWIVGLLFGAIGGVIGPAIGSLIASVLVAPLAGLAVAIMYFALRANSGDGGAVDAATPPPAPPAAPTV
jgi:hypothetical protein